MAKCQGYYLCILGPGLSFISFLKAFITVDKHNKYKYEHQYVIYY